MLVVPLCCGLAGVRFTVLWGWELIAGLDSMFMAQVDQPGDVIRAIELLGSLSCVRLGAYPMLLPQTRWCAKPVTTVCQLLNVTNIAAPVRLPSPGNNIPTFRLVRQLAPCSQGITGPFSFLQASV